MDGTTPPPHYSPLEGESQKLSQQATADAVGGNQTSQSPHAFGEQAGMWGCRTGTSCGSFTLSDPAEIQDDGLGFFESGLRVLNHTVERNLPFRSDHDF